MKIQVERSGGFAGIGSSTTVDTQSLSPNEANEIQKLIQNSHFFEIPSKSPQYSSKTKKGAADYFTYKITIQNDEREHSVQFNDINMQPKIKPLLDFLMKHSQK